MTKVTATTDRRNIPIPVPIRDALKELSKKYQVTMTQIICEMVASMYKYEFGGELDDPNRETHKEANKKTRSATRKRTDTSTK